MSRRSLPYAKGSATSKAAAESMIDHAPTVRHRIFQFLVSRAGRGATDDEIEQALNLSHQTASARRNLLVRDGAIEDSHRKRPTRSGRSATVWIADQGFDIDAKRPGRPRKSEHDRRDAKVTAYFARPLFADLCLVAADEDRPVSQVIRQAVAEYIDRRSEADQDSRGRRDT